ncbi:hypothetical protein Q1695_005269 [Nippostrongylus brasiliensis]|nr:hypothetical protein Q1695_005269 [Nippostrongylus brasiliensis]
MKRQADAVTVEIGESTTAMAEETTAAGEETTAAGEETTAAGEETTAAGEETTVAGEETTVAGAETTAAGEETTAAGEETTAAGEETTAAGMETTAAGEETTAAGEETTAAGEETTAAGEETTAAGEETTAAGEETTAAGEETTAAGEETTAAGEETTEKPYVDEPVVPKGNYVDEPYVPKGKSSSYDGGEQKSDKVSQGGYSGNVKVEPSGYRVRRANEYGDESVTPPPAETGYAPVEEETPQPADQGYGNNEAPPVVPGGYRKKRANEYGDENVTPPPPPGGDNYGPVIEETPIPIDQGYPASQAPPVYPGGYRKKRANEYGDEHVTPPPPPGGDNYGPVIEETPIPIDQGYPASQAPPVYPGGYRKKRANEYGDENVTPPPPPGGDNYGPVIEETPIPIDQGYPASHAPPVVPGGYRKKRANEYGDENVTPPPPPGGDSYGPVVEETPIPIDQGYPASQAPPVYPGGYRKKRANEYGDENVTPPPPPGGDNYGPVVEETPIPIDQGYPASQAPPVVPGGYRKKRANEYGDENVTPPPPPGGDNYGPVVEETPAPIDQGYPASQAPPVYPGGYRKKRANEYGDENVTPPPPPGGDNYGPVVEETPAPIDQGYPASQAPPVYPGGYRKKRANEYGDENVTPPPPPGGDNYGPVVEETPIPIDQGYPASQAPPVVPGGYRKKRANEYGDENVTPPPPPGGDNYGPVVEETPIPIDQGYPASQAPPVYPGGYRKKRANEYGDENVTPPPPPGGDSYGPVVEETPIPIDQGYPASQAPPVYPGGYRKKRANEYGDENVTPPLPPGGDNYGPVVEETPAPIDQGYPASQAPPVYPGGYRKKRANEYGDENVTPPPPPGGDSYGPVVEETPIPIDQGYPASQAPPVYPGGYRKKRANEYGDENVTPPPPPGGDNYGPVVEETPAPIDQGYPASQAPPVYPGGYRKKRANEYGDENVTPPPPPGGDSYGPVVEETPIPIDQGYPASQAPPVYPGGYRKKRANEYGDENVTPPPPPGGDNYGPVVEETPIPIDQGYPASQAPPVVPGGYRKKRANEYGDENVTPPPPPGGDSYGPVVEETPAPIDQGYPASQAPPVYPGGY